ncbi:MULTISPECIES: sensor histidine kinase KdpD [unclassified Meiothermus]|uniref:sensor histidine kinase n=1 Tax=unclassified Meiothermus TaxID=370471 RepID=UPI000D7C6840|nr:MULTISPECIES: HAMP domain-containing sensor histidine kinase [unclassified Meiothermus]PZA07060.1 sensor histidine kinase [Meiothermus sp. Pnk-1]RYM40064.1 HAMP domain-containing histidine kinase [Meiothermus sp. PNK-Is4]
MAGKAPGEKAFLFPLPRRQRLLTPVRSRYPWVWVAFGLVVLFLVAQVSWWMIFQRQLIQQSIAYAETTWLQEAALVQRLWSASDPAEREALARELHEQFPQLRIEGDTVSVDPERLATYRNAQLRHLRMLAFEGPFFLLVALLGLYIIGQALRREQDLKRRQQNFLMAATHEFRTPISTVRLLAQTLERRELPREKQLGYLAHMHQELSRLEALTERLLATARLEARLSPTRLSRLELGQVVAELLQRQRGGLEARGAVIVLEPAKDSLLVELDEEAFGIVLSNLLDNAIKYTPGPEKPVWIRLERQGNEALLHVEDRGSGVDTEDLPYIFDPFYRSGNELTREVPGLGIGLYLVKAIMELLRGTIACTPLERGSRFTLRLPLVEGEPPGAALEHAKGGRA